MGAPNTFGSDSAEASLILMGGVPTTRQVIAGAGLAGGGDLSADRTLDVVANADGSIVVAANDVKVGVLATDAQHGVRGGGTQHATVVAGGAAGFMTGADKTKLDGIAAGAVALTNVAPLPTGTAAVGVEAAAAHGDHVHDHGTHTDPTDHALVTQQANGFMSAGDKLAFDNLMARAPTSWLIIWQALLQNGTGNPEGVVTAIPGAVYSDTNGGGLWYKISGAGNTGWIGDLCGAGTPEGAVAAPIGSTYKRTNGGAGTCLYVKESGTGNTGWVAK